MLGFLLSPFRTVGRGCLFGFGCLLGVIIFLAVLAVITGVLQQRQLAWPF